MRKMIDEEEENYDYGLQEQEDDDFTEDSMPESFENFITSEGNFNEVLLKTQAKDIAAIKTIERDINNAPFFQTTKHALRLKVRTYTDPTNVLAILQTTKDALRHFEIDITSTLAEMPPHDVEQPELHNIIRSLRHLYDMYLTRAINGLERDKQGVIEHRSQNRTVLERKIPAQREPKKRFSFFRGVR